MRVVIAAAGSRGDAAPFGALAQRLIDRGHEVVVLTHERFVDLLPRGVEVRAVLSDPETLLSGPAGRALTRVNPVALNRSRHEFAEFLDSFAEPARVALSHADVLVASTFANAAVHEAMSLDVPVVRAHLWPELVDLGGPMPLLPYSWRLPAPVRRTVRGALRSSEKFFGGVEGEWSSGRLQLTSRYPVGLTTRTVGTLHAYSPLVEPDALARVDAENGRVTGWWRQDDEDDLSTEVLTRLATGGRWIFVGFGSMHTPDPQKLVDVVARTCQKLGVRAFLQVEGASGDSDGLVTVLGAEPHEKLFAHVDVVIHHGGAGTTGTVVRSGKPSVVVPHFADQYYWAHRLAALGVAASPLPRPLLTSSLLTLRVSQALRSHVRESAVRLGREVAAEDGVGSAVDHLEWCLGVAGS